MNDLDSLLIDASDILKLNHENFRDLKNSHLVILGGTGCLGLWMSTIIKILNDEYKFNIKTTIVSRNLKNKIFLNHILNEWKNFYHLRSDVRNLSELPNDANYIIHAATDSNSKFNGSQPFDSSSVIVEGTFNILKACYNLNSLKKISYLSSGLVVKPNDIYSHSKKYAEIICDASRQQDRLPIVIIRPYTIIGPFQQVSSSFAHTMFIEDAINNNKIRLLTDGSSSRGYIYGLDAAYWTLIFTLSGIPGDRLSLGSNEMISIKDLAQKISSLTKNKPEVISGISRRLNHYSNSFEVELTNEIDRFNYKIFTNFDNALKKSIIWFEERVKP